MVRVIAGVYEGFECAVIDGSETSDWFKIKSGVNPLTPVGHLSGPSYKRPEATPVAKINNIEKSNMIGHLTVVFLWFLSIHQS